MGKFFLDRSLSNIKRVNASDGKKKVIDPNKPSEPSKASKPSSSAKRDELLLTTSPMRPPAVKKLASKSKPTGVPGAAGLSAMPAKTTKPPKPTKQIKVTNSAKPVKTVKKTKSVDSLPRHSAPVKKTPFLDRAVAQINDKKMASMSDNLRQFELFMQFQAATTGAKQTKKRPSKRLRYEEEEDEDDEPTFLPSELGASDSEEELDDSRDVDDLSEDEEVPRKRRITAKPKQRKSERSTQVFAELVNQNTTLQQFGLNTLLSFYDGDKKHGILPVQTVKQLTHGTHNLGPHLRKFIAYHAEQRMFVIVRKLLDAIASDGKRSVGAHRVTDIVRVPSGYLGCFTDAEQAAVMDTVLATFLEDGVPVPEPFAGITMDVSVREEIHAQLSGDGWRSVLSDEVSEIARASFNLARREAAFYRGTSREADTIRVCGTRLLECWLQRYDLTIHLSREALREISEFLNADEALQDTCSHIIANTNLVTADPANFSDQEIVELARHIAKVAPNVMKAAIQVARFRQYDAAASNITVIQELLFSGPDPMPCNATCILTAKAAALQQGEYVSDRLKQLRAHWQTTPEAHMLASRKKKIMFGKPCATTNEDGGARVGVPPTVLEQHRAAVAAELKSEAIVTTAFDQHIARAIDGIFHDTLLRGLYKMHFEGSVGAKGLKLALPVDVQAEHERFAKKQFEECKGTRVKPIVCLQLGGMRLMNSEQCQNLVDNIESIGNRMFGDGAKLAEDRLRAFLRGEKAPDLKHPTAISAATRLAQIYHMFYATVSSQLGDSANGSVSATAEYYAVVWLSTLYSLATKHGYIGQDGMCVAENELADKQYRSSSLPLLSCDVQADVTMFRMQRKD